MKGTNAGAFQGMPPTSRSISLPGIDAIEIGIDGIQSMKGYFDTRVIPEQLGLQVLIQPFKVAPFSFGNSTAVQLALPQYFLITKFHEFVALLEAQHGEEGSARSVKAKQPLSMRLF